MAKDSSHISVGQAARPTTAEPSRFRLAMILLAVLLAFALLLGVDLIRSRQLAVAAADRDAENLSLVLEGHVRATLDKIDVVLRESVHDFTPILQGQRSMSVLDGNRHLLWQEQAIPEAQVESLRVIGADGKVLYSASASDTLPNVMVSDRAYFLQHKNTPQSRLIISEPILSRFTGQWLFVLSRRIQAADGSFLGLVQSAVRADYIQSIFSTLNVGDHGNVSLFDQEFRLAARHPALPDQLGKSFGLLEVRHGVAQGRLTGTYQVESRVDGIFRHYTYRKLTDHPFYVLIGVSPVDFLHDWTIKLVVYCVVFLSLASALVVLFVLLSRQAKDQSRLARQVFAHTPDGMVIVDAAGQVVQANDAFRRMVPECKDTTPSPHVLQGFLCQGAPLLWEQIIGSNQVWRGEVQCQTGHETPLTLWLAVTPMEDRQQHYLLSLSDITGLKQAEGKLRQLTRAVDQGSDMVLITDCGGQIEYVNDSFCRNTGYARDEILGRTPGLLRSPDAPNSLYRELWTTILDGRVWSGEFENRRKDGSHLWVAASISPIRDDQGIITHFLAVETDIGLRKEMEARLIAAKETAEQADRTKSEFLATMSHEIRTPMNGIIGMCGLLLDTGLDAQQSHYAHTVRQSAEALLTIINDILDFSRIESGRLELEEAPFEIRDVVEGVVDLLVPRLKGRPLELRHHIGLGTQGSFMGDAGRLRQVLLNLVGNAVKFTEQGHITVWADLLWQDQQEWLRLEIHDTGIGIPESVQGKLFSMFTQADPSIARRHGGSGLGLAICKRIVEMVGGQIGLTSQEGHGSQFWFQIPLRRTADAPPVPRPDLGGLHGLVVDDDPTSGQHWQRHLDASGMRTMLSTDVPSALGALRSALQQGTSCDLLLLDHHLPGLCGLDLAAIIRQDPQLKAIPIVLLSAEAHSPQQRAAGFADCLLPSCHPQQLLSHVARLVGRLSVPDHSAATPTAEPHQTPTAPTTPASHALTPPTTTGSALRILVVEDNAINQQVAVGMLKKLGHRPDVANDGGEGVSLVERCAYDLVLMDMQMPNVDGITATRLIRQLPDPQRAGLPIIAMTANAMAEDRERCLQAGMDDYLSKPIDRRRLSAMLEKWSPSARALSVSPLPADNSQDTAVALPDLDRTVFDDLVAALGNGGVAELLNILCRNAPAEVLALSHARQKGDLDQVGKIAHSLKGAALNVGLRSLSTPAMHIENAARAGAWPDDSLYAHLDAGLSAAHQLWQDLQKEDAG